MSKQKIKDYITQIRGVSYKPADVVDAENGTPIIRANNIQDDGMIYDDLVFVTQQRIKDNQLLKKGDIVICTSSGSKNLVGKATTFNGYETDMSFGAFCKSVRISGSSVNPDFIRLFFKSKTYREQISASSTGANINNIKAEHIDNLLINIPPVEIQNIAVGELSTLIKSISIKKQQLSTLNDLVKSRFIEMFGNPDANEKGWEKSKLENFINVVGGYAFKSKKYLSGGIPVLRIGNINAGYFKDTNLVFYQEDSALEKYKIYPNDLVISLTGTAGKDDYGNICLMDSSYDVYYLNQRNAKIEIKHNFNRFFLMHLFAHPEIKQRLTGKNHGIRQGNILNKDILELDVYVPPIELQNEFADFVKLTDKSKFVCQSNPSIFCVKFLRFRHPP